MRLRTPGPSRPAFRRLFVVFIAAAVGVSGCQPAAQVTKYSAPQDPPGPELISDEPGENEPAVRILGAIAPAGKPGEESWYFFKFQPAKMGETYTPKAIDRHAAEFNAFIQSLKFNPDGPPSWTVPAGWGEVYVLAPVDV